MQLEDQLDAAQKSSEPPAKRARTSATEPTVTASAGASKAGEKKRKMQLKKIFDRYAFVPRAAFPLKRILQAQEGVQSRHL